MKHLCIISFCAVILKLQFLPAQAPDTLWTNTFGGNGQESGNSVQETTDGGYIIVGNTESYGAGRSDIWLIKTDSSGDTLWTKTFGGVNIELGQSVQQTKDGGYIIVGNTESYGAGRSDIWLIKTDSTGETLWTKTFGGSKRESGLSVQQTTDGGYIITGDTESFGTGWPSRMSDVWLIKTDSSGDTLWTKIYRGEYHSRGKSVQQTSDGGYIVVGYKWSGFKFSGGTIWSDDFWLIKTDYKGDTLWTKTFGEHNHERAYSVRQTTDGGYIIVGTIWPKFDEFDEVWLIKTDNNGDILWTKTFGAHGFRGSHSVCQTTDGGYILTGYTRTGMGYQDVMIVKTTFLGNTVWTKAIGGKNYNGGNSVIQTSDGGYIITGRRVPLGADDSDVYLIKTIGPGTKIEQNLKYLLHQNYPNPFNPGTTITFELMLTTEVTLKIFNILGEEVVTLVSGLLSAGSHSYDWDASKLASGVYLYRLQASDYVETRKMVLIR